MTTNFSAAEHERWMKWCTMTYGPLLTLHSFFLLTLLMMIPMGGWIVLVWIGFIPVIILLLSISVASALWVLFIHWDWWVAMVLPLIPVTLLIITGVVSPVLIFRLTQRAEWTLIIYYIIAALGLSLLSTMRWFLQVRRQNMLRKKPALEP